MKIAILTGTSGLVGMQLLNQLVQNPIYDYVLSMGRRKLSLKHDKLVQISGDMSAINSWDLAEKLSENDIGGDNRPLIEALTEGGADVHAFCALGTTIKEAGSKDNFIAVDHDMVIQFGIFVKTHGADKFLVVSALGADPESNVFYNQIKGKMEKDLRNINFGYLGIFRPSLLLGNRKEFRLGEEIAKIFMKPLVWFSLWKKGRPIYDYKVAKAMVKKAVSDIESSVEIVSSAEMQDLSK